jgi:hypothetical protein
MTSCFVAAQDDDKLFILALQGDKLFILRRQYDKQFSIGAPRWLSASVILDDQR